MFEWSDFIVFCSVSIMVIQWVHGSYCVTPRPEGGDAQQDVNVVYPGTSPSTVVSVGKWQLFLPIFAPGNLEQQKAVRWFCKSTTQLACTSPLEMLPVLATVGVSIPLAIVPNAPKDRTAPIEMKRFNWTMLIVDFAGDFKTVYKMVV